MSALSSVSLGSSLPATSMPPIDPALEPESVRNGNQAAKNAYQEGLSFENILVNELAQEMTQTVPGLSGSDDSSDDGLGGSDDSSDSTGLGSSSPLSAYSSLLPQALTSSIMSGGGTGIALQIAQSIDPALANPSKESAKS
ncbi:MAG TPA: hypothetical protein VHX62_04525 [Solirubrobacteraceae bacterium]|jgi:Rod binding domain-containing protein|nr:hypothetical protein [Solirubrobacteraceae bacterium]